MYKLIRIIGPVFIHTSNYIKYCGFTIEIQTNYIFAVDFAKQYQRYCVHASKTSSDREWFVKIEILQVQ